MSGGAAVEAVAFDLDGTLIDSRGDIAAATLHALTSHGFAPLPVETLLTYVGDGARPLLARSAGIAADDARLDALYASFLEFYTANPLVHTRFCRGAERALSDLSSLKLALCTNKPRVTTLAVLEGLGILDLFAVIVAGNDLPRSKPDPLPIQHIAGALSVAPRRLVMVGDGAQDILAARGAGARAVGLRDGIQPIERLLAAKPEVLLDSLEELPSLIASWNAEPSS
ncbi:MAG TPA: HAD-IA family hydrolase [Polyangiaceae bacterium]|nr:HAD-IA family hydrolase [Polyangiaceae bacterium]